MVVACRRRRWPPARVAGSCALVLAGMAILAGVSPRTLRLGRGEWETVAGVRVLRRTNLLAGTPRYARNRTAHATLVMFTTLAAGGAAGDARQRRGAAGDFAARGGGQSGGRSWGLLLALTLGCTLVTFTLMNHWQRHLEATRAGLIYCAEPVWTSLAALFLPAWLAYACRRGLCQRDAHPALAPGRRADHGGQRRRTDRSSLAADRPDLGAE